MFSKDNFSNKATVASLITSAALSQWILSYEVMLTQYKYIPVFVQKEKKYNNMQYRCTTYLNITHTNHVSELKKNGCGLTWHHTALHVSEKERLRHTNRKRVFIFKQSKIGDVLRWTKKMGKIIH